MRPGSYKSVSRHLMLKLRGPHPHVFHRCFQTNMCIMIQSDHKHTMKIMHANSISSYNYQYHKYHTTIWTYLLNIKIIFPSQVYNAITEAAPQSPVAPPVVITATFVSTNEGRLGPHCSGLRRQTTMLVICSQWFLKRLYLLHIGIFSFFLFNTSLTTI